MKDMALQEAAAYSGIPLHALTHYFDRLFEGIPIHGSSILDVGGSDGLLAFLLADRGATVTCLEPMANGSNKDMIIARTLYAEAAQAGANVTFVGESFQNWITVDKFDVVIFHNSINHPDEDACTKVQVEPSALRSYHSIFQKVGSISKSGAYLLVSDCANRNLFGDLGIRSPFASAIEWEIHQQPGTWGQIVRSAGFSDIEITWNFSSRSPTFIRRLFRNAFGAYITSSHFTLKARHRDL